MRPNPAEIPALRQLTDGRCRNQTRVVIAAALAFVLALALGIVAVALGVDAVTNHGTVGAAARNLKGGRASPAAGVWMVVVCLTAGAAWLVRGARRALRQEAYLGIVAPFGILLIFGSVGEITDLLGRASGISDLVGAGILLLAAVPVALLWRPLRESYKKL